MSVLPLLLLDLADELNEFGDCDDDFGFGLNPQEIRRLQAAPRVFLGPARRRRNHPYAVSRKRTAGVEAGDATKKKEDHSVGKDGFQVCMDVSQFKPNELTVKTVDNTVVVEGNHEQREDEHGLISRQFVRKYILPKGYDATEVVSTLSSDGVLTIKAPPPTKAIAGKERLVQIQQTGPAHLSVKENPKEGAAPAPVNSENGGQKPVTDKMED